MGSAAWAPVEEKAPSEWTPVAEEPKSAAQRFFDPINPMHLVHALFKPSENPNEDPRETFGKNALNVLKNLKDAHVDQFHQAKEALDKGDYTSTIGHAIYGLVPVIGPMGDQAAAKWEVGDHAGALGILTAILGPKALHEAAPAIGAAADVAGSAIKEGSKEALAGPLFTARRGFAGAIGSEVGAQMGIPRPIGGAIGAATPGFVRGAIRGAKSELALRELLNKAAVPMNPEEAALAQHVMENSGPPEAQTVMPTEPAVPPVVSPVEPPASPIPLQSPHGIQRPGPGGGAYISPGSPHSESMNAPPPVDIPTKAPENASTAPVADVARESLQVPSEKGTTPAQKAAADLAESLTGSREGGTIAPEPSIHPPDKAFEAAGQASKARVLADRLKEHGISYADAQHITPESLTKDQWETILGKDAETGAQHHAPSQETIDQARALMTRKAPEPAPSPVEQPKPKPAAKPRRTRKVSELMNTEPE